MYTVQAYKEGYFREVDAGGAANNYRDIKMMSIPMST
jgi:hypothetical protein